jgi:signal transduction histidine kinase
MMMQADREADAQTAPGIRQFNPRTAPGSSWLEGAAPRLEHDSDFLATLLAMAAHDLRQPLQVITGAHDLLAGLLRGDSLRFVLGRAEDAATRLGVMLAELAEALQLHILARDPPRSWPARLGVHSFCVRIIAVLPQQQRRLPRSDPRV